MDSGLALGAPRNDGDGNFTPPRSLRGPKSRLRQRRAAFLRRQCLQKRLYRRALFARRYQREIIMLFGKRNEAQARGVRDRRDGHAPVGALLRHGGCDRVMRARLIPVAVRARVSN